MTEQTNFIYKIPESEVGMSYKEIIRKNFTFSSRLMTKLKQQNLISVNGDLVRPYMIARTGDILKIDLPAERSDFIPEDIPISVVYEDDNILIIDKQPGFVVHPTKGHPVHTMANGIMKHMIDTEQSFKIRFINRLDMDTSGLLAVAKNSHSQDHITKQMQKGQVKKIYTAIVSGHIIENKGVIQLPIGRPDPEAVMRCVMEDGYPSITHYKVIDRFTKPFSLVELVLETGRTHQIRVHMSHIGYPLLGDSLYGRENPFIIERQALHAGYLSFIHPITGELMVFQADLPSDMKKAVEKLKV